MAKQLSHQKTTSAPEAGWHQDPSNPNMQWYWDGHEWADMRFHPPIEPIEEWSTSRQVAVISVYVLAIIAALALMGFLALGSHYSGI